MSPAEMTAAAVLILPFGMYLCSLIVFFHMKHMIVAAAAFAVLSFSSGAQAVPDTWFSSFLFPDSGSVVEGDGMYSVFLGDGRSIFLMGDSYIGTVSEGKRISGDHMYRNTYIVYDHERQRPVPLAGACGPETSAAVPEGVTDESSRWFWPGHGFTVGDRLYVFQQLMYSGSGPQGWNFHYDRTYILQYALPDISLDPVRQAPVPYDRLCTGEPSSENPHVHFGAAALNDIDSSGYLYIYAQVDIVNGFDPVTDVYIARTVEEKLFSEWEYFDGEGWSVRSEDAAAMQGLSEVAVSSQFNVFRLDGKYVLLTQDKSWNSGKIYTFISDTPCGPWSGKTLVYRIPDLADSDWYTYNAMAHPQFENDGRILVSYNVNSNDFSDQKSDVESYRPRFIWVDKKLILGLSR